MDKEYQVIVDCQETTSEVQNCYSAPQPCNSFVFSELHRADLTAEQISRAIHFQSSLLHSTRDV